MIRRPPRSPLFPYTPLFRPPPPRLARRDEQDPVRAAERGVEAGRVVVVDGQDPHAAVSQVLDLGDVAARRGDVPGRDTPAEQRSEEHTSELQSQSNLVCRLL